MFEGLLVMAAVALFAEASAMFIVCCMADAAYTGQAEIVSFHRIAVATGTLQAAMRTF